MSKRMPWLLLLLGLLLLPPNVPAASFFSSGTVDNTDGTPSKSLRFEGFEVSREGFITGYIVNSSDRPLKGIRLDIWTTNPQETQIYWRGSLVIDDLPPGGRYAVKESYNLGSVNPARIKFKFRIPSGGNYRNLPK